MKNYLNDAVTAISESIRFDSSLLPPEEGMPFGKPTADCLNHFLSLAKSLGFATRNYDNYVGEAIWQGAGEGDFAVLAHLDVVPAGKGWTKPPFGGIVEDGKIWGRGAMDDKGPAFCSLFAMKKLKDEGFIPQKTIKLIVGCNEECGWECIAHYNKVATMPETGFTPDADFPVIYAEKGILHVQADFKIENAPFASLTGGERVNMVCDYAEAAPLAPVDLQKAQALGLQEEGGKLIAKGKSAHGSTPEKGVNALLPLLEYFNLQHEIDCLFRDKYGVKALRDETGKLTLSPNVACYQNGVLSVCCDIRYPASLPLSAVMEKLNLFGAKITVLSHKEPLYQKKTSPLIATLSAVFDEYTGKHLEPIAIGGGTYARALKCGAGFGPELPGEEVTIHQANEYITIERVGMLIAIYSEALRRLT